MVKFFMAYARDDDPELELVVEFYQEVHDQLRVRMGLDAGGTVGLLDVLVRNGADWDDKLTEGLRECHVLVPLFSPLYFNREFCGREWGAFEARISAHGADAPHAIRPLVWQPASAGFNYPHFAHALQHSVPRDQLDDEDVWPEIVKYHRRGLSWLMKRRHVPKYRTAYLSIQTWLVDRILEAGQEPLSPVGGDIIACVSTHPPHFARRPAPASPVAGATPDAGVGRRANFVYVTGSSREMQPEVTDAHQLGRYGPDDRTWKPYAPNDPIPVAGIAQHAVVETGCFAFADRIPCDDNLLARLRQAEEDEQPTVLVIDPWVVRLDDYRQRLEAYDTQLFNNTDVVVAWPTDDKPREVAEALRRALKRNARHQLAEAMSSSDALRSAIGRALREINDTLALDHDPGWNFGDDKGAPVVSAAGEDRG